MPLSAQTAVEPTAQAATSEAEPEAVPLDQLSARGNQLEELIRRVEDGLAESEEIAALRAWLPEASERLTRLQTLAGDALGDADSLQVIDDVESRWRIEGDHIGRWSRILEERLRELREWASELDEAAQVWEATEVDAEETASPSTLRARIRSQLDRIAESK